MKQSLTDFLGSGEQVYEFMKAGMDERVADKKKCLGTQVFELIKAAIPTDSEPLDRVGSASSSGKWRAATASFRLRKDLGRKSAESRPLAD